MRISVVMTTYNGERYLEQQLNSILSQTLTPGELIVCDDGSTDGTVAILERYRQQNLLTYVVNESQLGLVNNFKKAVSMAAPDNYIALADQDDEWVPEKLEKSAALMRNIDNGKPCMIYTDLMLVDENDKVLNPSFRNELGQDNFEHNLQTLLFGNFITGCTVLMNPALGRLFADIPEGIRYHDGWIGLAAFTFGAAAGISEALVRYRKHGNNLSIAADTKPRNRYRSTYLQMLNAIRGKDDFLSVQFNLVGRFYDYYSREIDAEKKMLFERFLQMESRSYLYKKIAFRRLVKRFPPL